MDNNQAIINKVSQSSIITLNLEDYFPNGERIGFDIKDQLFEGLILKEKDFRSFVSSHNWENYKGKNVALFCSTDAIIPTWAFMLVAIHLSPNANHVVFGDLKMLENSLFQTAISKIDIEDFRDRKVVVKGCGAIPIPPFAYVEISRILRPVASSIMYGEPCSTVPLYKRISTYAQ